MSAALLATEQTWQVIDRYRWPIWLFWLLIIVMLGVSVLNTPLRMIRGEPTPASGALRANDGSRP